VICCHKRAARDRRRSLADCSSKEKATETVSLFLFFLLQKHWSFLLHEVGLRKWVWNFYVDGVRFLHVDRDIIRDRYFVRDIHRVRHCLLNRVGDFFLHEKWIRLGYFNRIRFFYLHFHWNFNWIKDLFLHGDGVRFFNRDLHFLVDDDGLDLLVGDTEAGVGVAVGGSMALWGDERTEVIVELRYSESGCYRQGQQTDLQMRSYCINYCG